MLLNSFLYEFILNKHKMKVLDGRTSEINKVIEIQMFTDLLFYKPFSCYCPKSQGSHMYGSLF